MKKIVRLTEGDLVRIIKKVISENDPKKQKTQPGELTGDRSKLSKLKNNLDLLNKGYQKVPQDITAHLAKYGITPQPGAKIKSISPSMSADIQHFLMAINAYIIKNAEDKTIQQYCSKGIDGYRNFCWETQMQIILKPANLQYSRETMDLDVIPGYKDSQCKLFSKVALDFGYGNTPLNAYPYIKNKLSQMINDHVKEVITLIGYTC